MPLFVGAALRRPDEIPEGIVRDDVGDNISSLNPLYCELTAIYWMWKNINADAKGLVHYRRAFAGSFGLKMRLKRLFHIILNHTTVSSIRCNSQQFAECALVFEKRLPSLLKKYDCIVAKPIRCSFPIERSFLRVGDFYLDLLESTIAQKYTDYLKDYLDLMEGNRLHYGNLTVMRSKWFDAYCEMMFDVLDTVNQRLKDEGYLIDIMNEKASSRRMGYLAELLTHTFVKHNQRTGKMRVKVMPATFLDPNKK
ncbi:MAG: DUF4422 domain-containing protein [Bacteroides sp.]|nr:DUF4422 domain-containing protein [Bacteroides sp.]